MNSLEEAIRDHLRLRGQPELSREQLRELLGRSLSVTPPRPPRERRRSEPRPRPAAEGGRRLRTTAIARARAVGPTFAHFARPVAARIKPPVEAVRPHLPRLGLALAALGFITVFVPAAIAATRTDRMADGLHVGGVSIGGLSAEAAHRRLEHRFAAAQRKPLVVRSGKRSWRLTPSESRVSVDVSGAVRRALEHSRRSPFPKRLLHALVGGPSADLRAPVTFSEAALERLTTRISVAVERPPRDATVRPSGGRLLKVADRPGVTVIRPRLARLINSRLASAGLPRELDVPTRAVEAEVTLAGLPGRYEKYVVIRRSRFRLDYFQGFRLKRSYPIAVGRQGLETRAGDYEVQSKQVDPVWHVPRSPWAGSLADKVIPPGPKNPIKARWLGFDGSAGIHGTAEVGSLGQAASHGCVRMSIPDVKDLYRRVPAGTPVRVG